jgi:hypothetical protein
MTIEPTKPLDVLNTLTAALTQLRQLAALPPADPFYTSAAEQVAAIVTELESRVVVPTIGTPEPPSPGVISNPPQESSPLPEPPIVLPDPPSPG